MPTRTDIQFGLYALDFDSGELSKDGTRIHIQEQPLKVLRVLLEHPGELVTRDQLKHVIAPDSTFGDFDHALNIAVAKLRTALNDPAEHPLYIETLHKRGYRFIAPVNESARANAGETTGRAAHAGTPAATTKQRAHRYWLLAVVAVAFVVVCAVALIFTFFHSAPAAVYLPVAFTTVQGVVSEPAFSPDGSEIAFAWQNGNVKPRIYVQALGSVVARSLVEDPDPKHLERSPRWAATGRSLAYIRQGTNGVAEIWQVPRTGGPPRKLFDGGPILDFDIAPDGNHIVVSEGLSRRAARLILVSLADMSRKQLTDPEDKPWSMDMVPSGDRLPRFSPDGRTIAFLRLQGARADLWRVSVDFGTSERLSPDSVSLTNSLAIPTFTWAADGRSLVVVARLFEPKWWRFWLSNHRWEPMAISGGVSPTVSLTDGHLAYVQSAGFQNIWRFEMPRPGHDPEAPVNLTRSTAYDGQAMYSPDGNRFAFCSSRTGHFEIYVANSDGSNTVQLTFFNGKDASVPRWSPDGKQIVFDYRPDNHAQIFSVDANGGPPRQLTFGNADAVVPRYSRDGKWIYFMRTREGGPDLWKMPSGGGTPVFVVADATSPEETTDGENIIYVRFSNANKDRPTALCIRAVTGGEERVLIPAAAGVKRGPYVVVQAGIFYREQPADNPHHQLLFYDFATRRSRLVMDLPFPAAGAWHISISPDGRYYLEPKAESQSNIMLIEDFH